MKKKNGFTLIELLAVIVILSVIMVIAVMAVNKQIKKSKMDAAISSSAAIKKATDLYKIKNNKKVIEIDFKTNTENYGIDGTVPKSGFYLNDAKGKETFDLWYEKDKICVRKEVGKTATAELGVDENTCLEGSPLYVKNITSADEEYKCYTFETNDSGLTLKKYNFFECGDKYKLVIPNNVDGKPVTRIGQNSINARQWEEVTIPSSVKAIEKGAFQGNRVSSSYIKKLVIKEGVEEIGDSAFANNLIPSLTLPEGLKIIGNYSFMDNNISSLVIPSSVKIIGQSAFSNNKLESLKLSDGIEEIGQSAFRDNKLIKINLPKSITSLGNQAFVNNYLTNIYYDCNVSGFVATGPFAGNLGTEVEVTIGNNVTKIENYTFKNINVTKLNLSKSVTHIGYGAFSDNKIKELTIPSNVTYIQSSAFSYNPIETLTIEGNKTRFNSLWTSIGFPEGLKPTQ